VHRSPVRKFANASEGVGHRHKLTKLVEESNNLNIMIPQLLFLSERGFICQCIVYAIFGSILPHIRQIGFRGKLLQKSGIRKNEVIELIYRVD